MQLCCLRRVYAQRLCRSIGKCTNYVRNGRIFVLWCAQKQGGRRFMRDRYCQNCGEWIAPKILMTGQLQSAGRYARRKWCSVRCAEKARPYRKPGQITRQAHMRRARKACPAGPCQKCGKSAEFRQAVHHIDQDYTNSAPENLVRLCAGCHMREHRPLVLCRVCERPQNAKGYCKGHYYSIILKGRRASPVT